MTTVIDRVPVVRDIICGCSGAEMITPFVWLELDITKFLFVRSFAVTLLFGDVTECTLRR